MTVILIIQLLNHQLWSSPTPNLEGYVAVTQNSSDRLRNSKIDKNDRFKSLMHTKCAQYGYWCFTKNRNNRIRIETEKILCWHMFHHVVLSTSILKELSMIWLALKTLVWSFLKKIYEWIFYGGIISSTFYSEYGKTMIEGISISISCLRRNLIHEAKASTVMLRLSAPLNKRPNSIMRPSFNSLKWKSIWNCNTQIHINKILCI